MPDSVDNPFIKKAQASGECLLFSSDEEFSFRSDILDIVLRSDLIFMSHCGMGITPSPLGEHFSII